MKTVRLVVACLAMVLLGALTPVVPPPLPGDDVPDWGAATCC